MLKATAKSRGQLVARALAGAWRFQPPALELGPEELDSVARQLLQSGAGALGWWRARHATQAASSPTSSLKELQQAYRLHSLQALIHEQEIERVFLLLKGAGVEPLLVKGWAAARLYPEEGLRPYGDIDLCVRPEQFALAEAALKSAPEELRRVDLHDGFERFGGGNVDEIFARSRCVRLGEVNVRVASAEDHLRILCTHMLREGAWRPLWLCDIAAAVEARAANFDWDCCLTKDRRLADWVVCAVILAGQLLGADVSDTPAAGRAGSLPRWLVPAILKEWASPLASMPQRHRAPMAGFPRAPLRVLKALRHRWPNPIEATVSAGGLFDAAPRLPLQLSNCLARAAGFAARLPKSLREK
jgi:hypothetical protein